MCLACVTLALHTVSQSCLPCLMTLANPARQLRIALQSVVPNRGYCPYAALNSQQPGTIDYNKLAAAITVESNASLTFENMVLCLAAQLLTSSIPWFCLHLETHNYCTCVR